MLSDEEKEAIEELKNKKADYFMISNLMSKTLLNLIEKQFKEIEELNSDLEVFKRALTDIEVVYNKNYISKDKIKEILGIEEDINNEKLLSLLQTIVDENARLEDIEDRKVQIEYNNVFNKGVKSVEDKIKAKIEPKLKELDEQMKKEWKEYGNSREYQDMEDEWNFLQSLLEKE